MANDHIVKIIGLYDQQMFGRRVANGYFMEFMPGGSVREAIENTKITSCPLKPYLWIAQTAKALIFLHEKYVYHGDVKPDNLLLSTDWSFLKLADFGTSTKVPQAIDDDFKIAAGTPLYMSPELFKGIYPETRKELLKSDNYSLAITIWEIFHKDQNFEPGYEQSQSVLLSFLTAELSQAQQRAYLQSQLTCQLNPQ